MANAIELAKSYVPLLDEVYAREVLTSDLDGAPELTFADALEVMIEDDAPLTADPLHGDTPALATLVRGTRVLLLARYDAWGYVQTELGGTPVRAFVPMATIL